MSSIDSVPAKDIPPELQGNLQDIIGDAQMVWCLGNACIQIGQSNLFDANLSSLFNLMTVKEISNRPTIARVSQVARNMLNNTLNASKILKELYQQLMGDINELVTLY